MTVNKSDMKRLLEKRKRWDAFDNEHWSEIKKGNAELSKELSKLWDEYYDSLVELYDSQEQALVIELTAYASHCNLTENNILAALRAMGLGVNEYA